jgi:hypothetical protein
MADLFKNFASSTVATPPSPATSGTSLYVQTGHGVRFPGSTGFWATVWPAGATADITNAEIVRVTYVSGDQLSITRARQSTTARAIVAGDQIAQTITAADHQQALGFPESLASNDTTKYPSSSSSPSDQSIIIVNNDLSTWTASGNPTVGGFEVSGGASSWYVRRYLPMNSRYAFVDAMLHRPPTGSCIVSLGAQYSVASPYVSVDSSGNVRLYVQDGNILAHTFTETIPTNGTANIKLMWQDTQVTVTAQMNSNTETIVTNDTNNNFDIFQYIGAGPQVKIAGPASSGTCSVNRVEYGL